MSNGRAAAPTRSAGTWERLARARSSDGTRLANLTRRWCRPTRRPFATCAFHQCDPKRANATNRARATFAGFLLLGVKACRPSLDRPGVRHFGGAQPPARVPIGARADRWSQVTRRSADDVARCGRVHRPLRGRVLRPYGRARLFGRAPTKPIEFRVAASLRGRGAQPA